MVLHTISMSSTAGNASDSNDLASSAPEDTEGEVLLTTTTQHDISTLNLTNDDVEGWCRVVTALQLDIPETVHQTPLEVDNDPRFDLVCAHLL